MAELDLDARRAEAQLEDHKLTLGGKVYLFPAEVPLLFGDRLNKDGIEEGMQLLLGEEEGSEVALLLSDPELITIAKTFYGDSVPELQASPPSLNRAGRRSKPTSKGSTAST